MDLKSIKWTTESLQLKDFVETYKLPQIVSVEEGFYGTCNENSFSSGQKLKLHSVTSELRAVCYDRNQTYFQIPLTCPKLVELKMDKPKYCKSVADIKQLRPLPNYVKIQSGYFIKVGVEEYKEIYLEACDTLKIMFRRDEMSSFQRNEKFLVFQNDSGDMFELPFDCSAGFKTFYYLETYRLNEILPRDAGNLGHPVYFQFANSTPYCGILQCTQICNVQLIIGTGGEDHVSNVFNIPYDMDIKVKIAKGTITHDNDYDIVCSNYHDFKGIEEHVRESRSSQLFKTPFEVYSHPYEHYNNSNPSSKKKKPVPLPPISREKRPVKLPQGGGQKSDSDFHRQLAATVSSVQAKQTSAPDLDYEQPPTAIAESIQSRQPSAPDLDYRQLPTAILGPIQDNLSTTSVSNSQQQFTVSVEPLQPNRSMAHTEVKKSYEDNETLVLASRRKEQPEPSVTVGLPKGGFQKQPGSFQKQPVEVRQMSVGELGKILKELKLEKHVNTFEENLIDGHLLCMLTDQELKDIGLNGFEIRKITSYKEGWRPKL